jgi:hypothetical protein
LHGARHCSTVSGCYGVLTKLCCQFAIQVHPEAVQSAERPDVPKPAAKVVDSCGILRCEVLQRARESDRTLDSARVYRCVSDRTKRLLVRRVDTFAYLPSSAWVPARASSGEPD